MRPKFFLNIILFLLCGCGPDENSKSTADLQHEAEEAASMEMTTTSEGTVTSQERTPLFQGTKVFCDSGNQWYYIVTVDGDYIILSLFPGIYKKENSRGNPKEVIAGKVIDGYRIITKGPEGNEQEVFTYTGSQLNELGYENSVSTYTHCE